MPYLKGLLFGGQVTGGRSILPRNFDFTGQLFCLDIALQTIKKLEGKWWEKLLSMLKNSVTWKGLLYLFLRFPLGLFAFILIVVLLSVSLSLLATPVIYILIKTGTLPGNIYMIGGWTLTDSIIFPILAGLLGLIVAFFSLHIFNGLAYVYGLMAKFLLGSEKYVEKVKAKKVKKKA